MLKYYKKVVMSINDELLSVKCSLTLILFVAFLSSFSAFIFVVFLNQCHRMQFIEYIPVINPAGHDLRCMISYSKIFLDGGNPYPAHLYPPLTCILFAPLCLLPFHACYVIITLMTLAGFLSISFLMPYLLSGGKIQACSILLSVAGLYSYGLHFELERGQSNIIAFALCAWAVYIYHRHWRHRFIAYALFIIAVQMKLYPAIFVFAFSQNPLEWKNNIARWTMLGLANLSCLTILGWGIFISFMHSMLFVSKNPAPWVGNASWRSLPQWIVGNVGNYRVANLISITLLLVFIAIWLIAFLLLLRKDRHDGFKHFLFLSTIGTILIPPVSHDYKMSIIIAAYSFYINRCCLKCADEVRVWWTGIIHGLAAYIVCVTLFPPEIKWHYFGNNFVPLFGLSIATLVLMFNELKIISLSSIRRT
jgi:hypothetical protein